MKTTSRQVYLRPKTISLISSYIVLAILMGLLILPVVWMISMSFKGSNLYIDPYSLIPKEPSVKSYQYWLLDPTSNFWVSLRNSFGSFVVVALLTIPIGSIAAYTLARWKSKWVNILLMILFFLQLMPIYVMVGPLFKILIGLKIIRSVVGLYAVYVAFNLPLVIYTMRNYMLTISSEIEDAARVDGCSLWQSFCYIYVPLCQPALLTSALFVFVNVWLEYLFVNVLMSGKFPTLAILLINATNLDQNWRPDLMLSLSVLIMIPLVILFPLMKKYMVTGLTAGAVK